MREMFATLLQRGLTHALPFAALMLLVGWANPGAAQESIGKFGAWSAYKTTENGNPVCYMASRPTKDEGNYTRRDDIYTLVIHRPAENSKDMVLIVAGYSYQDGSQVAVKIGSKAWTLNTEKDTAWAPDSLDPVLVKAMIRGATMVVQGTSSRGTLTTDTYSLRGFTKSYGAISEACGY